MANLTHADGGASEWNVLTSPWVDVETRDAEPRSKAPLDALEEACSIKCLAIDNPFDDFAAHRFLLTLLYWKADLVGGVPSLRESLLEGVVPQGLIDNLRLEAHRFHLFDHEAPVLQDASLEDESPGKSKSPGSLFAELPSGTNIAHFHHTDDADMRLCLRCATLGMLRVVPWTQAGGAGLTPSVHNAPPVMALAVGADLCVTLGLNLVPLAGPAGAPQWTGHFVPSDSTNIPYMEALTWNPRRINLRQPEPTGECWRCGQTDVPVVGHIVYAKNEETKKQGAKSVPFAWRDPSAFYGPKGPYVTLRSTNEGLASLGTDIARLADGETGWAAQVVEANPDHREWRLIVPSTNPANNKSYDHRWVNLPGITTEAIGATVPQLVSMARGRDGWALPERSGTARTARRFVRQTVRLLTDGDWATLATAAYREMAESPAAFDVLTSLLWGLRDHNVWRPSPDAGWLVLKLMASVPRHARESMEFADFSPLSRLPLRQLSGAAPKAPYPTSLPRGNSLEQELRNALDHNLRRRAPRPVDWGGLCADLHRLFTKQPSLRGD